MISKPMSVACRFSAHRFLFIVVANIFTHHQSCLHTFPAHRIPQRRGSLAGRPAQKRTERLYLPGPALPFSLPALGPHGQTLTLMKGTVAEQICYVCMVQNKCMSISNKLQPNRTEYLKALRRLGPAGRFAKAMELSQMTRELFLHGLRKRFPEKTDEERKQLYLERLALCHNRNY
jgi:hypothetical protein